MKRSAVLATTAILAVFAVFPVTAHAVIQQLHVTNSPNGAGSYPISEGFGAPPFTLAGVSGPLVVVPAPGDACAPMAPGSLTGAVAIARRFTCNLRNKVINVANAGAVALVVYDVGTDPLPQVTAIVNPGDPPVSIPFGLISAADGATLLNALMLGDTPTANLRVLDTDGDGVPDNSDGCPQVASMTSTGCPAVALPAPSGGSAVAAATGQRAAAQKKCKKKKRKARKKCRRKAKKLPL